MSALGHKRTCAVQKGMSALPSKADMCGVRANVAADRPIVSSGGWDNWVPRTDPHQCAARFTYGSSQGEPSGAKSNPNRERLPFKQRDVGRALAGVLSKGLSIEKVEIHPSTGMITITTGKAGSQQAA